MNEDKSSSDSLRHVALPESLVPEGEQRERRELVAYRTGLVQDRLSVVNRLEEVLEGPNIRL